MNQLISRQTRSEVLRGKWQTVMNKSWMWFFIASLLAVVGPVTPVSAASAAYKLTFTTQPANTTVGAKLTSVVVQLKALNGTNVPQSGTAISLTLNKGAGLAGTTSVTTDAGGKSTFTNLSVTMAGSGNALLATASSLIGRHQQRVHRQPGQDCRYARLVHKLARVWPCRYLYRHGQPRRSRHRDALRDGDLQGWNHRPGYGDAEYRRQDDFYHQQTFRRDSDPFDHRRVQRRTPILPRAPPARCRRQ